MHTRDPAMLERETDFMIIMECKPQSRPVPRKDQAILDQDIHTDLITPIRYCTRKVILTCKPGTWYTFFTPPNIPFSRATAGNGMSSNPKVRIRK